MSLVFLRTFKWLIDGSVIAIYRTLISKLNARSGGSTMNQECQTITHGYKQLNGLCPDNAVNNFQGAPSIGRESLACGLIKFRTFRIII